MAVDTLWAALPELLRTCATGDEVFAEWLRLAEESFRLRDEKLEDLIPAPKREKLLSQLHRTQKTFFRDLPLIVKPRTRAVWMGLFEQARASGYTLTTYASISQKTSKDDKDWECSATINKQTYVPLPALTKAHQKPKGCTDETATALYVFLPIAFVASVVFHAARQPGLKKVDEYGFGWDDGDLIKWRP